MEVEPVEPEDAVTGRVGIVEAGTAEIAAAETETAEVETAVVGTAEVKTAEVETDEAFGRAPIEEKFSVKGIGSRLGDENTGRLGGIGSAQASFMMFLTLSMMAV